MDNNKIFKNNYSVIEALVDSKNILLVKDNASNKFYIEKIISEYNLSVYEQLYYNPYPGIPKLIEFKEFNDQLYTIEEYIQGESLDYQYDYGIRYSEKEIAELFIPLCETLEKLHALTPPVIHRDIKPSNILVNPIGSLILIDFNAARQFRTGASEDTVFIGTAEFAAPEQYGYGQSSNRTDVYGIGATIVYLLTGKGPKGNTYSGSLLPIIKKCTKMDPDDRYQSISLLKEALIEFVSYQDTPIIKTTAMIKKSNQSEVNEMTNIKLQTLVQDNEWIYSHINTEADVNNNSNTSISADRLKYTKDSLMFYFRPTAPNIDYNARDTYFEVHFYRKPTKGKLGTYIIGNDTVYERLSEYDLDWHKESGDLKYYFHISDEDQLASFCQMLIDTYKFKASVRASQIIMDKVDCSIFKSNLSNFLPEDFITTEAYKNYEDVLIKVFNKYGDKFIMKPHSLKKARAGQNRGIQFYLNDKCLLGIHVNTRDFRLYIIEPSYVSKASYELKYTDGPNPYVIINNIDDLFKEIDSYIG